MPCRNVIPKPLQKPHPPMWLACTNRDTIKVAARNGLGALCFAFLDPDDARTWARTYYDIIKSNECVPLGHSVNANLAMVSGFSLHEDRAEAIRRGEEGFEFFGYALNAQVAADTNPGRTTLWQEFQQLRAAREGSAALAADASGDNYQSGIGTPDDMIRRLDSFADCGVDQIILMQQCGKNLHADICASLELFGKKVLPQYKKAEAHRQAQKDIELAPYIKAALARKKRMPALSDDDIPVIPASVKRAQVNQ